MNTNDRLKAEEKVRRPYLATGIALVTVGGSLQTAANNVHVFVPQIVASGVPFLMLIAGVILLLIAAVKGRNVRLSKEN